MDSSEKPEVDQAKITRDHDFKWIAGVVLWGAGYFWLRVEADFPYSFGLRLPHGEAGVFEQYWYSYLLLQRHGFWDVALFVWLWGSVLGVFWFMRWRVKAMDTKPSDDQASGNGSS